MTTKTQLLPTRYTINYQHITHKQLTYNNLDKSENNQILNH